MAKQKTKFTEEQLAELDAELVKNDCQSAIDMLKSLERAMYLQGDRRASIIREALDLLDMHEIASVGFQPTVLGMPDFGATTNNPY